MWLWDSFGLYCEIWISFCQFIIFFVCYLHTGIWWYNWRPKCLHWLQTGFNSCCAYYCSHHWQKDVLLERNGSTWKFIKCMWYVIQLYSLLPERCSRSLNPYLLFALFLSLISISSESLTSELFSLVLKFRNWFCLFFTLRRNLRYWFPLLCI